MNRVFGPVLFALVLGCGSSTPASPIDEACPPTVEGCMSEEAIAQCREMYARCGSEMRVLESCPLQFACP